ncbi:hypothetical protein BVX97_05420, partial [bacterium E08(2017)]
MSFRIRLISIIALSALVFGCGGKEEPHSGCSGCGHDHGTEQAPGDNITGLKIIRGDLPPETVL